MGLARYPATRPAKPLRRTNATAASLQKAPQPSISPTGPAANISLQKGEGAAYYQSGHNLPTLLGQPPTVTNNSSQPVGNSAAASTASPSTDHISGGAAYYQTGHNLPTLLGQPPTVTNNSSQPVGNSAAASPPPPPIDQQPGRDNVWAPVWTATNQAWGDPAQPPTANIGIPGNLSDRGKLALRSALRYGCMACGATLADIITSCFGG